MEVPNIEAERARTRGRGRHAREKTAAFILGFLIIFSQLCLSSAENNGIAPSHWSPARKARFFHKVSSFHAVSRTNNEYVGRDDKKTGSNTTYEDDKRIVHTGPNPLHN